MQSCNVAFGKLGLELGDDAIRAQAEKFGFNEAFEVPMRSVASRYPEDLDAPQTALSAIGQFDVRATPLQMAMVVSAVANRGVLMAPYLIQDVLAPNFTVLDSTKPRSLGEAVSPQTAADLTEMLVAVVEDGTGTNAQIPGIKVAGKTGTAQQGPGKKPHAWFVSFAPADVDPKVAVAVVLEEGGDAPEVSGNQLAAPIAQAVMKAVLGRVTAETDRVLGGRYRLTERIAGGGMGEVWRAQDDVLGRDVAVKILRREYADDPTFLERFRAEARHTAGLSHANIAAVYDFGEGRDEGGSPYLVMEYVPGEPLSALVSREGRLGPDRTLDIIGHAALGLQAAHDAGVIHRDVKPGNILVTPDGVVKITDFGIARATNSVPLTQTGAIMGTAYYISPEQASGQSVSPGSDIYSLGHRGVRVPHRPAALRRRHPGRRRARPGEPGAARAAGRPARAGARAGHADARQGPGRAAGQCRCARPGGARPAAHGGRDGRCGAAAGPDPRACPAVDAAAVAAGPATPDPRSDQTTVVVGRLSTDTDPGFRLPDVSQAPRWLPYALAPGRRRRPAPAADEVLRRRRHRRDHPRHRTTAPPAAPAPRPRSTWPRPTTSAVRWPRCGPTWSGSACG